LEDLKSIKALIKSEIKKTKEELLKSDNKGAIRFFLDSISDDIREMINEGFNYKQQLEIINKSTKKGIKYNTYIRYVKGCILKQSVDKLRKKRTKEDRDKEREFGFTHEAVPDVDELY
jgi:uncharacterized Fe-S cluster-containing MiaB family protein